MSNTLLIRDETATGQAVHSFSLDFLNERITVRELIRERVYEEVRTVNASNPATFRTLVQPNDTTATASGYQFRKPHRQIDWEWQFARACEAFERNGFFILVDNKQVESLDDEIDIRLGMSVSFIKLVPLVGG